MEYYENLSKGEREILGIGIVQKWLEETGKYSTDGGGTVVCEFLDTVGNPLPLAAAPSVEAIKKGLSRHKKANTPKEIAGEINNSSHTVSFS